MNTDHDSFDALARHKLEERSFAYDAAHWEAAQALMQQHARRRRFLWWLPALTLILAGGAWWWMRSSTTMPVAQEKVTTSAETASATIEKADADGSAHSAPASTPREEKAVIATTETPGKEESATNASMIAERIPSPASRRDGTMVNANTAHPTINGHSAASVPARAANTAVNETTTTTPALPLEVLATAAAITPAAEPPIAYDAMPLVPVEVNTPPSFSALAHQEEQLDSTASPTSVLHTPDTAARAAPEAQLMPAPRPWRWELSALGGALLSTSGFSGEASTDWSSYVEGAWAPQWGGELAATRNHFGVGIGLHYVTFSERLRAEQLTEQLMSTSTTYSQDPILVTVLMVVDTIFQGGNYYYVTQPVDTLLNQLVSTTDTSYSTLVKRPAMDETNRVSYWEIPLFADVHTSCGRWSLGLRGGPVVGFLSQQRTTLPLGDPSGMMPLGEETYTEVMFGWTARAYARYRFTEALSIGLEPMMRGQFGNALDVSTLERRNRGWGGLLSVNWRLP